MLIEALIIFVSLFARVIVAEIEIYVYLLVFCYLCDKMKIRTIRNARIFSYLFMLYINIELGVIPQDRSINTVMFE